MDTKAAFDREAFAKEHGMTMEFVNWFFDKKAAGCGQVWFMMAAVMWEGWKGAHAEIEIELKQFDEFQMVHYGTTEDYAKGYVDAQSNANKAITSHGIRIKGKNE